MATKKTDVEKLTISPAAGSPGANLIELEEAKSTITNLHDQVSDLDADLQMEKKARAAEQDEHLAEVKQLNDVIVQLQGKRNKPAGMATPEEALNYIIGFFETVAVGGSATGMRQAVHDAAAKLDRAQRTKLREYVLRLRGAAEAAEQETATLFQ